MSIFSALARIGVDAVAAQAVRNVDAFQVNRRASDVTVARSRQSSAQ